MLNPTSKFARSWALFTSTLQVLRQHPKLLLFPIVTFACTVVMGAFFLSPAVLYPSGHALTEASHWKSLATQVGLDLTGKRPQLHPGAWLYAYAAVVYLVSMVFATFANVALYQQILQALGGQPVSVRAGIRFAASRWASILAWSLFAGLVGLIIKSLEERFGLIGRLVIKFVGMVWSVASVFAIPVIIREGSTNPVVLLRNSANTLRKTWGESLIGYAGMTIASWIILLPTLVLLFATVMAGTVLHAPLIAVTVASLLIITLCVFSYIIGVASDIYRCALYVYASEGVIPEPYNAEMMNMAWKVKKA